MVIGVGKRRKASSFLRATPSVSASRTTEHAIELSLKSGGLMGAAFHLCVRYVAGQRKPCQISAPVCRGRIHARDLLESCRGISAVCGAEPSFGAGRGFARGKAGNDTELPGPGGEPPAFRRACRVSPSHAQRRSGAYQLYWSRHISDRKPTTRAHDTRLQ